MKPEKEKALLQLRKKYRRCKNCKLRKIRNKTVFGRGACKKRIVIMGEAPGPDEDRVGDPFVGKAGKMLDKLMKLASLERNDTFIFNTVQCYPGRNDTGFNKPSELQIIRCSPRWWQVLTILKPKLVIVLGDSALFALTNKHGIKGNRGLQTITPSAKSTLTVFVTYHPSACGRNPEFRKAAEEDWRSIGEVVHGKAKHSKPATKSQEVRRLC